jgi:hypothetical protein
MPAVQTIVEEFTRKIASAIEAQVLDRVRGAVSAAFGGGAAGSARRGRQSDLVRGVASRRTRRRGPKQLCPVPGCKNPAAPVFGMVCSKHKDLPKAKIKKYREMRRAKKLKAAA